MFLLTYLLTCIRFRNNLKAEISKALHHFHNVCYFLMRHRAARHTVKLLKTFSL